MSETKPADLTFSLQKATEGFTSIVYFPTDTNIINTKQLLFPVLIKTKYNELNLTHNLSGVILPTERCKHIYSKGAYLILPVIALYYDIIDRNVTRKEVHQDKGTYPE